MRLTPSTATSYTGHCHPGLHLRVRAADGLAVERDRRERVVPDGVQVGALEEVGEEHHEVLLLLGGGVRPALPEQQAGHLVEVE